MWIQALDVCLFGLVLYLIRQVVRGRARAPLPPGPHGWPLIGNLLDVPTHAPHKAMGSMSREYGPIMSLNLMGTRYVVLNSPKAAKDLLVNQSAITSDRPHFTMGCDLVGWRDNLALLPYGDSYRKYRKFFYQQIGTKNSLAALYPAAEAEIKQLLSILINDSDGLISHCHRMSSAVILKISHGYTVQGDGDPIKAMARRAMENFSVITTPGRFLVDTLPILRYLPEWLPGCGFQKDARRWRKMLTEAVDTPYKFVLEHLAKGDAAPSFISRSLEEGVTPADENILKWASFSMYLAGSDTTPSALSAFFLAMTIYPEIFKRAQAEVDAVIGNHRLPTIEDRDALPYVNAICLELLRWHSVPSFVIHVSTEDIIYEGYLIPKGAFLLPNIWSMLSDPETYPDPEVFDPERFLGDNQQLDPREMFFGWGRRSCPGALMAELMIFTCITMSLATLNVSRHVENGVECVPKYEVIEGIVRHVKPFKCRIVPRSKHAEDLLQA